MVNTEYVDWSMIGISNYSWVGGRKSKRRNGSDRDCFIGCDGKGKMDGERRGKV